MGGAKKSKTKGKSVAKASTKAPVRDIRQIPDGVIFFSAVCVVFLMLVDSYYIWILVQARA